MAWARHPHEVQEAQRLRQEALVDEMGSRRCSPVAGYDVDLFDDFCEHLLVRDEASGQVVGTCRVLTPDQARRVGGLQIDTEFDLTRLRSLRERMMEVGRTCVHPSYPHGGVFQALWGAVAECMVRNELDTVIGCVNIPMLHRGVSRGDIAASIWRRVRLTHLAPIEHQVRARLPLPVTQLDDTLRVALPALFRGYLRLGAKVLCAPGLNVELNTADFPVLLRISE